MVGIGDLSVVGEGVVFSGGGTEAVWSGAGMPEMTAFVLSGGTAGMGSVGGVESQTGDWRIPVGLAASVPPPVGGSGEWPSKTIGRGSLGCGPAIGPVTESGSASFSSLPVSSLGKSGAVGTVDNSNAGESGIAAGEGEGAGARCSTSDEDTPGPWGLSVFGGIRVRRDLYSIQNPAHILSAARKLYSRIDMVGVSTGS